MREFIAIISFDEDTAAEFNEVNGHEDSNSRLNVIRMVMLRNLQDVLRMNSQIELSYVSQKIHPWNFALKKH